ncbi:MAG TPA: MBG domain-containing protein [Nitrospirota bacterium]|nr:MBG domain-containing protein [Nitrospirota bacterium]
MSSTIFINRGLALVIVCILCGTGCAASMQTAPAVQPIRKTLAKVTLSNLKQTYDGAPKLVKATTRPEGLAVSITYDGKAAAPVNADSYKVIATVQDANFEGSATATLTIAKASQKIIFDAFLARSYGDADFSPGAATSSGLPVSYKSSNLSVATIVGSHVHIVGAGSSTIIVSQPGDNNYLAAEPVQRVLTVNKAKAKVTLTGLDQIYDGSVKRAGAVTEPAGLTSTLTYNGNTAAPTGAGSYLVVGMVKDANYEGSATATLTIAKAPQRIAFDTLVVRTYGDKPFVLYSTVSSGLTASYGSSNPAVAVISRNKVRIAGAGTTEITAYQAGDNNYLAAEPIKRVLTVNKAKAKITLTGLNQAYDGAQKQAGAKTDPKDLTVVLTYDNNAAAPTSAGTYSVTGAVQDANYEGSATAALTIAKAPQSMTFNALAARTFGDAPFALAATVSSGLTATYESSNTGVATISGNEVTIAGAGMTDIAAYQAGDENHLPAKPIKWALTVKKATQTVTFNAPVTAIFGDPDFSPKAAASSGLPVFYTSSNPSVATIVENRLHIIGAGSSAIIASQPGDKNYLAAEPAKQLLTVGKAKAEVTLTGLNQPYDGTAIHPMATTQPGGLSVTLAYNGKAEAPTKAGTYTVTGTIHDANYEGSATTTLTIAKAPQRIVFDALSIYTSGDRPFTLYSTVSSNLTATYGSSTPAVATVSGNKVRIMSAGTTTITAYQMGDGNYQPAEPVQQVLIVRGVPHHIAVLPLVNMSGQPAPVKEMRQALLQWLVAQGVQVLEDGDMEQFLTRHRVRNMDGIDAVTAEALKKETGADAVLITTLELYTDTNAPEIAMTSRLVAAENPPIILWMETVGLSGDDSPGLLGLGLIHDMARLQKKAFDRITGSFAAFLAGREGTGIGRGEGIYKPKEDFSTSFMQPGRKYTVAVAPFLNRSERDNADNFLALHFISQLVKAGTFNVIDWGELREKLLFFRFILQEGLSVRQADLIHNSLQADLILTGEVAKYEDMAEMPKVEFNVLVFERKRLKVVWASWSHNKGDDGVHFFDWGQVSTAAALASKMTRAVIRDMTAQGMLKEGQQLPEEPSSMTGIRSSFK